MRYDYSFYNIVIKENEEFVYLYNSYSGALCKLEKKIHNTIINNVLTDDNKCMYFDELLKQGFIKPFDLNEYNKIILTEHITVLSKPKNSLTYVIAPTLACNLNCDYCFEKGYRDNSSISDELLMEVADYINNRTFHDLKEIHIVWFGGEPLIAYDKILKFSRYLIPKLEKKQIRFTSSMISNGVLLTKERAKALAERCELKKVQITIDGTKNVYCSRKHATEKQFDTLLENIKSALNHLKVSIRLNCDGENYEDLKVVTKLLVEQCGKNNNLNIYLAKLVDYDGCGRESFYSQEEFDIKQIEFNKYVCALQGKVYEPTILKYRKSFCGLFKLNNQVIGPNGELYKCEHHVGQADKVVGNIKYGLNYNDFLIKFVANMPQKKCKTCKIFPLCLGGCPAQKFDLPEGKSCYYSELFIKHLLLRIAD